METFWRQVGRLETKISADEKWSDDGQCAVISPTLIATAAHVCFYDRNEDSRTEERRRIERLAASSPHFHPHVNLSILETQGDSPPITTDSVVSSDMRKYAKQHSLQKFAYDYVPFPFIQACFCDIPPAGGGPPTAYAVECKLLRHSGFMDVAILQLLLPFSLTESESSAKRLRSSSTSSSLPHRPPFVPMPFAILSHDLC